MKIAFFSFDPVIKTILPVRIEDGYYGSFAIIFSRRLYCPGTISGVAMEIFRGKVCVYGGGEGTFEILIPNKILSS